jgi:hypothetical protein
MRRRVRRQRRQVRRRPLRAVDEGPTEGELRKWSAQVQRAKDSIGAGWKILNKVHGEAKRAGYYRFFKDLEDKGLFEADAAVGGLEDFLDTYS